MILASVLDVLTVLPLGYTTCVNETALPTKSLLVHAQLLRRNSILWYILLNNIAERQYLAFLSRIRRHYTRSVTMQGQKAVSYRVLCLVGAVKDVCHDCITDRIVIFGWNRC